MYKYKISLVISILNEEDNIEPLLSKIYQSLEGIDYEVVLVDDGSTDKTIERIKKFGNDRVKTVIFTKNFGQTPAMAAGIQHAQGEYIVTMDGDLQNDPADIPMMLEKVETGEWDMVAGNRKNRKDGMFLRKIPSKIANFIIRGTTDVHILDYGCSLKIIRSSFAKNMGLYGELHRFIPVLVSLQGGRISQVDVKHHPRIHGSSKYGLNRTFKVVSDLILVLFFKKYLQRPMHLFGSMGIISLIIGSIISLYMLYEKILGHDIWGRPLLLLAILALIAGIQLITFGLMFEMLQRTYLESQDKRSYQIRKVISGKKESE